MSSPLVRGLAAPFLMENSLVHLLGVVRGLFITTISILCCVLLIQGVDKSGFGLLSSTDLVSASGYRVMFLKGFLRHFSSGSLGAW